LSPRSWRDSVWLPRNTLHRLRSLRDTSGWHEPRRS